MNYLLIKDRLIPEGSRKTILVLHQPAPLDLNVMNFTTSLRAMITEGCGGVSGKRKKIWEIVREKKDEKKNGVHVQDWQQGCGYIWHD